MGKVPKVQQQPIEKPPPPADPVAEKQANNRRAQEEISKKQRDGSGRLGANLTASTKARTSFSGDRQGRSGLS